MSAGPDARPGVWFVCGGFGATSEPWLWRQITGFERIAPRLVCWELHDTPAYPTDGFPVHRVPFERRPMDRPGRWLYRLRNLPGRNFYASQGDELRALEDLARETRPDAMLCQFGHFALRVLPVARRFGIPVVAHFHGMDVSSMLRNRWYRWSLMREIRRFDAVVVVGSAQERWMREQARVAPERLHRIPCGTPTDAIRPRAGERRPGPVRFLVVARLVSWKGIHIALRALAEALEQKLDAELQIAGEGPERAAFEALAGELGVADRVTFHGGVSSAEVARLLEDADVLVQHSLDLEGWSEGFGVVVSEAGAAALPVIGSRAGGLMDQVLDGETGFLVPQHDVAETARAMLELGRDPALRERMGRAGRARVLANFDTRGQVRRLESVVLDVIAAGQS